MLKIAICENNIEECKILKTHIQAILKNEVYISNHTNAFSLKTYIIDEVKGNVDLLILDLSLNNENSVSIAEKILIKYPHIKIIFTTKTYSHIQDIFKITPTYLLFKPLEKKYLSDALFKVIRLIDESKKDFLFLKAKYGRNGILSIPIKDIYFISSDKRKLIVHQLDKTYEINMKLDDIEEKLSSNFLRCHQSYIVNMDKISSVNKEDISLFNDLNIPISRSKKSEVKSKYQEYLNIDISKQE